MFYVLWWNSTQLQSLDHKFYDSLSSVTAKTPQHGATVIVTIDEKSLEAFGQWPWPRVLSAELFEKIALGKPASIASDIAFPEPDRTAPSALNDFYRTYFGLDVRMQGLPENLYDNDRILGEAIHDHNIILPVFYDPAPSRAQPCSVPSFPLIYDTVSVGSLHRFPSLTCNLPILQNRSGGIGHIHATADGDGYLRRLPLIVEHNGSLIPILSVAAINSLSHDLRLAHSEIGFSDMKIETANHSVATDERGDALIRFYPLQWYRSVSAADVLRGKVDPEIFRGKFVFVGTAAFGLNTQYLTADNTLRSGVYIHAALAENIFNDDLVAQPSVYPRLNLFLSFLTAVVLLILMMRKHYLFVIAVFFTAVLIAAGINLAAMYYHLYLSGGYFLFPLASYVFLIAMFMFYIDYRNKQRFFHAMHRNKRIKQQLKNELDLSHSEIEHQKIVMFQQSKMAAMGEMIGNIAHQWRQPLNILALNIQNIEYAYTFGKIDQASISRFTEDSMKQILYMSHTIDDFRNFASPSQARQPFNIIQALNEALQLVQSTLILNHITYDIVSQNNDAQVMGWPNEFKQVIINLINNTKDALKEHNRTDGAITIRIDSDEKSVRIGFEDNALGIPETALNRIFEPYFTTKENGKGTGIGLYMAYQIIHTKMNGTIEVSNTADGARFLITLPLIPSS